MPRTAIPLALALLACTSHTHAQVPPSYGMDFVTIGAPGNRAATQAEAPDLFPPNIPAPLPTGSVGYEYRIARTEVAAGQWLEFAQAYYPFSGLTPGHPNLTGDWIRAANTTPGQNPGYYVLPGATNHPTDTSWQMAARYCNWLHNGKVNEAWAFQSGAYDTSTFTQNPDGTWNDQRTRSPGARYWIPSLDEWSKAMHFDPNKNGAGQEGYWRYPHSSDSPPVPGWPDLGGETNAGLELFSGPYLDVGSYPSSASPWGLLDGSGSQREWVETTVSDGRTRIIKGTRQFWPLPEYYDRIDYLSGSGPSFANNGFRIASAVPAPGSIGLVLAGLAITRRRRS